VYKRQASESALADCARQRAATLALAIASLDQAAAAAAWHLPVRAALADWWMARLGEAEAQGDEAAVAAAEAQAKIWDDGSRAAILAGEAAFSVPAGAKPVTLRRLATTAERTLAPEGPGQAIAPGTTVTLPRGRWLAESAGAFLAVRLERGSTTTFQLPPAPILPAGQAWIPGGQTASGESVKPFVLLRHEVRCAEWLEFLNDPETVRRYNQALDDGLLIYAPRSSTTAAEPAWKRRRNEFLAERTSGEAVLPNAPVTGISYDDACAYAAWRARRDGRPWRLPTASEWRFAVQGGDRRTFPWGDLADPSHCASYRTSPTDLAQGVPVGSFAIDCSVQGVFDLAGSVSEFVASDEAGLRLVLGGNRMDRDGERFAWTAKREFDPRAVHAVVGLRLAYTP
jgi:formylglycine-generating enzyme required for sulfatase activity